ncbi:MAG TPA: sigma-70 family RNA polymerase sigma factor [Bryobacteraceae bacterium]|nr:sigma-70 family RNA polymerase sigma factor [Bryobacteraceae bacterium]HWR37848.1 sigma-70 family RNA polymerase sigma factor [Clostridia bacterium]
MIPGANDAGSDSQCSPFAALALKVERGDPEGLQALHALMTNARWYFGREVGFANVDDLLGDAYVTVVRAIQRGGIRQPEYLMGYIRTVLRRKVAAYIREAVRVRSSGEFLTTVPDKTGSIEQDLIRRQGVEMLMAILRKLSARDREILSRFYLRNETKEEICAEMGLTDTQFRLLKSRAKARLADKVQRRAATPKRRLQTPVSNTALLASCA